MTAEEPDDLHNDRRRRSAIFTQAIVHTVGAVVTSIVLVLLSWVLGIPDIKRQVEDIHRYEEREIKEKAEAWKNNDERLTRIEEKIDHHIKTAGHQIALPAIDSPK